MQKIDGHVHFWDYDSGQHAWITEDMSVLRRNFLPGDIQPPLEAHDVAGCILAATPLLFMDCKTFLSIQYEINQVFKRQ
jgi:predicted TIM-barrel fold metal-dependent hydrolase